MVQSWCNGGMRKPRLPRNVEQVGDRYRASVYRDGYRWKSPLVDTADEAAELALRYRAAGVGRRIITLEEGFELVREVNRAKGARAGTGRFYEGQFAAMPWPKKTPLDMITRSDVREWLKKRLQKVTASTAAKNAKTLSRIFRLAMREDLVDVNPVANVDLPTPRPQRHPHLSPAELGDVLAKIRAAGGAEDADLIEFFYFTGLRRQEVANLRPDDVDLEAGRIFIDGKVRSEFVRIADGARELVGRILMRSRGDALVGTVHQISHRFGRWRKELKEPRLKPHAMRHSFGTALAKAATIEEAQKALRHKSITMTAIYYHSDEERAQATVDSLPAPTHQTSAERDARESRS